MRSGHPLLESALGQSDRIHNAAQSKDIERLLLPCSAQCIAHTTRRHTPDCCNAQGLFEVLRNELCDGLQLQVGGALTTVIRNATSTTTHHQPHRQRHHTAWMIAQPRVSTDAANSARSSSHVLDGADFGVAEELLVIEL